MPSLLDSDPNAPAPDGGGLFGLPNFDIGDALGHVYHSVKSYLAPEQTPLWPLDSPVGTSRVGGDTSLTMPDPNVSLAMDTSWGGSRNPTVAEWNAMKTGTQTVGGTLMAAEMPDLGPAADSSVMAASKRVRAPGAPPLPTMPRRGLLDVPAGGSDGPPAPQFDWTPGGGSKTAQIGKTQITYGVGSAGDTGEVILVKTPSADRGQGEARRAMEQFISHADAQGTTLFLNADPMDKGVSKGGLDRFYRSLGFVKNMGKRKDFRSTAEYVRQPSAASETQDGSN